MDFAFRTQPEECLCDQVFYCAAEEEEEEIKGNVKADQSSVADSTASGNKAVSKSCCPVH